MRAIVLKKPGGVDNLILKDVESPKKMSKNDIVIKHTFVGVNFDDILVRRGSIEMPKLESNPHNCLGLDGVGMIERVGSAITRFKVGQRVGYAFAPIGSYCERRVINANFCIAIPDDITDEIACAILRKGLAAHTMLFRCNVPKKGHTILVTGAGSGVGHIIARWAKYSELKVIGLIGNEKKRESATLTGCDLVLNYNDKDAFEKIADFTKQNGVHSVYDSIGEDVFDLCIKSLHVFGTYVSYGNTSGNINAFDPLVLQGKSLFFTKPRFELYKSNRNELIISVHELFDAYKRGAVAINSVKYTFNTIPNAHKAIESKEITGSVVAML